jgi:hypothetical protein
VRQWVLSFPFPIRFLLARSPKLQSKVLEISLRAVNALIQKKVRKPGLKINGGAVTILQRFGGSLNLNIHLHMLLLEGGYYNTKDGPKFWWIERPTDEEIKELVKTIAHRVIRHLKKQGHFADDKESVEEFESDEVLPELQAASVRNKVALGDRRGQWIRRIGSLGINDVPELTGPLCANIAGFSLHAAVYCHPNDRQKLEQLCRYIARPAIAEERLRLLPNKDVLLKLKKPYSDGTSHLVFSPIEFLEKLAALVPPPRAHLTRFSGVLAPHSKIRSLIVPKKVEELAEALEAHEPKPENPKKKAYKLSWAKLLKRVFSLDMENCRHCGGEMKLIAAIMDTLTIEKILKHVNLPHKPPDIARSKYYIQEPLF